MRTLCPNLILAPRSGGLRSALLLALVSLLLFGFGNELHAQEAVDPCVRGKDLYHRGDFEAARTDLEQCLEQDGDKVEVLLPLAVMAIREGRLTAGIEMGKRAVEVAPEDPEARYWYGRALLGQGRKEEARAQWEHGMQVSANHKGILEGLARLAIQEGQTAKAYNLLNQIRQQGVNEPWLYRMLADLASGKGMWEQAVQNLQAAMAIEGSNVPDLLSASELSIMAGQSERAVDFCREAVNLEPGEETYGGLGEAYFATENMDSALVYLSLAVAGPNPDSRFVFNLANALEVTDQYAEADTQFRAFLEERPADPVGHFNFGIHLGRQGQAAEGIAQVAQALELDPSMLNARVVLAQMKENVGDYLGALEQVEKLQQLDKENVESLELWRQRLVESQTVAESARISGKVHLLHMVLGRDDILQRVLKELEAGDDFGALAVQLSIGPAAAKGGDIGWINPADMKEPLRSAILVLGLNEISPPVESGGLHHIFKRVP